jgi:hypothetical protein
MRHATYHTETLGAVISTGYGEDDMTQHQNLVRYLFEHGLHAIPFAKELLVQTWRFDHTKPYYVMEWDIISATPEAVKAFLGY